MKLTFISGVTLGSHIYILTTIQTILVCIRSKTARKSLQNNILFWKQKIASFLLKKRHFVGTCIGWSSNHYDNPLPLEFTFMEKWLLPADKMSVRLLLPVVNERCSQCKMSESNDSQGCKDRLHSRYPLSCLYHQECIRTMPFRKLIHSIMYRISNGDR